MMGHREKMKGGSEVDAFTGWRRYYKYLTRAGVRRWIKQHFNRRIRHEVRLQLRRER